MNFFDQIDNSNGLVQWAEIAVVVAAAVVLNSVIRTMFRLLTRRAVRRALSGRGRWKVRLPRNNDGTSAEQRRVQRADAAAHMMARLTSLAITGLAIVLISRILEVDPLVLVSSAGFIGAGIAIGGQALIRDWLTGLLVLLEDRYAVGDRVTMTVAGLQTTGIVETFGGAGVRLRLLDGSTWHTGHGGVESVVNHSQQLVAQSVEVPADVWAELDQTMVGPELNAASHDLGLTGILLMSDIEAVANDDGAAVVTFMASRALNERQRRLVGRRIADAPKAPQD